MKRILAISIAVIMIIALVGCGDGDRKIVRLTLDAQDSEAILAAAGIVLPTLRQPQGQARRCASTTGWTASTIIRGRNSQHRILDLQSEVRRRG